MNKIILATTSPYRIAAFKFLGLEFEAEGSMVDESQTERKNPEALVRTLSQLKAEAVAERRPDCFVVGMDSVGCFKGKILEKPKSKTEAFERLKKLSGNKFEFYTGIHLINTSNRAVVARVVKSELLMRKLSEKEINQYLEQDSHYYTYALGFDPLEHISSSFIAKLTGSYNNILRGIPLEVIKSMLSEVGYQL